jgi:hypothetical protein
LSALWRRRIINWSEVASPARSGRGGNSGERRLYFIKHPQAVFSRPTFAAANAPIASSFYSGAVSGAWLSVGVSRDKPPEP